MALLQHLSTLATYLPHSGMLLLILIKLQARARRMCRRGRQQAGAYKKEGLPRWGRRLTAYSERGVHSFLPKLFSKFQNFSNPSRTPYKQFQPSTPTSLPLSKHTPSTSILDPILAISHVIPTPYFYSFS